MKYVFQAVVMLMAYVLLVCLLKAPVWAGVAGSWAFWAAIRPKEWQ